ncbi:MAG TPA: hypothetical protein VFZ61_32355, partial [Polyangiales bacterium]
LSERTLTELPAFRLPEETGGVPPADRDATPSAPPALPLRRPLPAPTARPAWRALPLVLGALVLLSTFALLWIRLR